MTIEAMRVYMMTCDLCGETDDGFVPRADVKRKADDARRQAREVGWIRRDGQDICPRPRHDGIRP